MGLFQTLKSYREMHKATKELAKSHKRPSLREGMQQATAMMQSVGGQQALTEHLEANGRPAEATIKSLQATGGMINNMPVLQMELSLPGGFGEDVTHTQAVSPALLGQLQPGATVSVLVDPQDSSKLVLK